MAGVKVTVKKREGGLKVSSLDRVRRPRCRDRRQHMWEMSDRFGEIFLTSNKKSWWPILRNGRCSSSWSSCRLIELTIYGSRRGQRWARLLWLRRLGRQLEEILWTKLASSWLDHRAVMDGYYRATAGEKDYQAGSWVWPLGGEPTQQQVSLFALEQVLRGRETVNVGDRIRRTIANSATGAKEILAWMM